MTAPDDLEQATARRLAALDAADVVRRIWRRDPTVWTDDPAAPEVADRLGWLALPAAMASALPEITAFATSVRGDADRVVLLGMGGSSLAPAVLARSVPAAPDHPPLTVLDSTHPAAVAAVTEAGDPGRALYVVASKSGTTVETASFFAHVWEATGGQGDRFVAITDPGTPLAALAHERGFRHVFLADPHVGGRFSALSAFGLVPAALAGVDVARVLARAARMAQACGEDVPAAEHPGARLGAWLGEAALAGRDKLGLTCSPGIASFGLWAEQLVAESTGKGGRGILPVVERCGDFSVEGDDRVFVSVQLAAHGRASAAAWLDALAARGYPVERIVLDDPAALGAEFVRWTFAVAVAGAVLGINPFDQPNVAESKRNTHAILGGGAAPLPPEAGRDEVARLLDAVEPGAYLAVLAYVVPSPDADRRLLAAQRRLRERLGAAVTVGYGPPYLHSTGQYHKGGPPAGHFIMLVDAPARDLPVPGKPYTFGQLMMAQALGDYRALETRGRPIVRLPSLDALEALAA